MNSKQKTAVRDQVSADVVTFKKDETVVFKRSYFYRNGYSAEKFAEYVVAKMRTVGFPNAVVVDAIDAWAAWPKTSYFVAVVKP